MNTPDTGEICKIAGPGSYVLALTITDDVEAGDYLYPSTGGALRLVAADTNVCVARAHYDATAGDRVLVRVMEPMTGDADKIMA